MNRMAFGKCECGCGEFTRIATHNDRSKGWIKGQPQRFVYGHVVRVTMMKKSERTRGNKYTNREGYVVVTTGVSTRQYEHILIAEKLLGRPLKRFGKNHAENEVVHHVDGCKSHNANSNLLICTNSYHLALHARLERSGDWPEFKLRDALPRAHAANKAAWADPVKRAARIAALSKPHRVRS
jgi:hypothetical protein